MNVDLIEIFDTEKICSYRGEKYRVRNNGAILRIARVGKNLRPKDNIWTFGNIEKQKGYLLFISEAVHRIVATAFHGEQPSKNHVVDHIDTNKQNNRPENLRWVTRLENILLNPITLSRIIYKYGSIEEFLSNPSKPKSGSLEQNFDWMRTVTKEESVNAKNNLLSWAKESKIPKGGELEKWVYSKQNNRTKIEITEDLIIQSSTKNAYQKNWKTPTEFPCCPDETIDLVTYSESLKKDFVFSRNKYGEFIVISSALNSSNNELFVIGFNPEGMKKYALTKITVENDYLLHENLGTFFELSGVEKASHNQRGLIWEGGDSIDNYM